MMAWLAAALFLAFAADPADAPAGRVAAEGAPIADWYREHVDYMTRDGGRWEASNAEHRSDDEPFETYVVIFAPAFGGTGLSGRLFGINSGADSVDFWHFRGYWDPSSAVGRLEQFGWGGTVGRGNLAPEDDHLLAVQEFLAPGAPPRIEKHEFVVIDANTHITPTYQVEPDGTQNPGRSYVWRRVN